MPSVIGWLDQSEEQQRRMREVIALFAESGTVDDIGIGVVRDAFSDLLFPAVSTVQTRPRYFLLIPWVYQRLASERATADKIAETARALEIKLIHSLLRGDDPNGVIGRDARDSLKQLPSFVYWNGLRALGVRTFDGTRSDYFRSLDRRITTANGRDGGPEWWHANLPDTPDDLWDRTSLALTYQEGAYLQERIVTTQPDSLFAHFARQGVRIPDDQPFPWDAVDSSALRPKVAAAVEMARYFSEVIYGASLLYNLMLAEASVARRLPESEEREAHYRERLDDWTGLIEARRWAYQAINPQHFWATVLDTGAKVTWQARQFVTNWLGAVENGLNVATSQELRQMILGRELTLKKGLARLSNPRALETWGGASGSLQLTFRWDVGRTAINDIADGLASGSSGSAPDRSTGSADPVGLSQGSAV